MEDTLDMRDEQWNDAEGQEEGQSQFEQLLDEYEFDRPKRGKIVEGKIIRIYDDMILVDIGAKRDAIVPRTDLGRLEDEVIEKFSRGDMVPVYIFRTGAGDDDLLVSINKGLMQEDWDRAKELAGTDEVVELRMSGFNKGGGLVDFGRLQGFVPNSHLMEIPRGADRKKMDQIKSTMIGTTIQGKVLEVDQDRSRLVFSEREAQQERRKKRLEELEEGQVLTGKVVNIVNFGAFIDLDGVDGLVHVSELDWERVDHPSDVLDVGEEIEVEVIDVDVERERISLSRKARLTNPWEKIVEKYNISDLVEGTVTNVRDYGAFVELPEGVVGLVHVSEIGFTGSGNPKELLKPGEPVLVRIIKIEPDKERISLSMQQVTYDEQINWMSGKLDIDEERKPLSPMEVAMKQAIKERGGAEESAEAETAAEGETTAEASEVEAEAAGGETEAAVETEAVEAPADETQAVETEAKSAEVEEAAPEASESETSTAEVEVEETAAAAETAAGEAQELEATAETEAEDEAGSPAAEAKVEETTAEAEIIEEMAAESEEEEETETEDGTETSAAESEVEETTAEVEIVEEMAAESEEEEEAEAEDTTETPAAEEATTEVETAVEAEEDEAAAETEAETEDTGEAPSEEEEPEEEA